MAKKIGDVEDGIARELKEARQHLPPGLKFLAELGNGRSFDVRFLDSRDRKLNRRGDAGKRSHEIRAMVVYLTPEEHHPGVSSGEPPEGNPDPERPDPPVAPREAGPGGPPPPARLTAEILRALEEAEKRPGYHFVSLKWFRDTVLPGVSADLNADPVRRQAVLRELTERRLLLTSKVPNPKNPSFPVTAVRVNRENPEVAALLAGGRDDGTDFAPVEIRGEPLSATILRERR